MCVCGVGFFRVLALLHAPLPFTDPSTRPSVHDPQKRQPKPTYPKKYNRSSRPPPTRASSAPPRSPPSASPPCGACARVRAWMSLGGRVGLCDRVDSMPCTVPHGRLGAAVGCPHTRPTPPSSPSPPTNHPHSPTQTRRSNTPMLLHEHNEFIPESVFLEGIDVFTTLIQDLASAPRFASEEMPACVEGER